MGRDVRLLRSIVVLIGILGSCAFLVFVAPRIIWDTFLKDALFTKVPPSATNPPIYPNAEQVNVNNGGNGYVHVSFVTTDKPADVLTFYKDELRKDRWFNPLRDNSYPDIIFEWHQAGPDGPTDLDRKST